MIAGLPLGAAEFSTLSKGTSIKLHCGPTNHKIRLHLGLIVPSIETSNDTFENVKEKTEDSESCSNNGKYPYIRVGTEISRWSEGKVIVFDDSFEHEVHNPSLQDRTVFILDIWHPELSEIDRNRVRKEFGYKYTHPTSTMFDSA